jgi:hypothetical protein
MTNVRKLTYTLISFIHPPFLPGDCRNAVNNVDNQRFKQRKNRFHKLR